MVMGKRLGNFKLRIGAGKLGPEARQDVSGRAENLSRAIEKNTVCPENAAASPLKPIF